MSIQGRFTELCQTISAHAAVSQVKVIAVSKYATLEQMIVAYEAGVRHFGENKIQDALKKMAQFPPSYRQDVHWHLIGPVQMNKVKKTLPTSQGAFDLIHSIDSVSLAENLSRQHERVGHVQSILLQVNLTDDMTRHGFQSDQLQGILLQLLGLKGIRIQGLMGMAPAELSLSGDAAGLKSVFNRLRNIRDELETITFPQFGRLTLPELSMGMSQDFIHALECGATMIRIGNYLFKNQPFGVQ
jgi:pyridoxal phosphate enzyme (YggS family)